MKAVNPYLNFAGHTEEAFEFYRTVFGGEIETPLAATEWAERYGSCVDRYGVRWQLNYTGDARFSTGQEGGS